MTEAKNGLAPLYCRYSGSRSGTIADGTLRLNMAKLNKERTTNAPNGQVLADMKEA